MAKDQLVTPLDKIEALPDFEGLPTIAVSLEVRGIDGGFNDGMTVDPVILHKGDTVFLLVEGVVAGINHKPIEEANAWRRAHVVKVNAGTIVTREFAEAQLDAQRQAIEEAKGIARLPFGDDLQEAHDRGEHADGVVEGCPDCDLEAELAAQENGDGDGEGGDDS